MRRWTTRNYSFCSCSKIPFILLVDISELPRRCSDLLNDKKCITLFLSFVYLWACWCFYVIESRGETKTQQHLYFVGKFFFSTLHFVGDASFWKFYRQLTGAIPRLLSSHCHFNSIKNSWHRSNERSVKISKSGISYKMEHISKRE